MKTPAMFPNPQRGMALLLVLAVIALLSLLVVSFFSTVQLNQGSQHNFVESARAEETARGALQEILGDLRQEMDAGSLQDGTPNGASYTVDSVRVFVPATNLTAVPARLGFASSAYTTNPAIDASKLPPSLNRVSRFGVIYPSYYQAAKLPPVRASSVSTTNFSVDGHRLQAAVWNAPLLLGTALPAAFAAAPPDWIYVTRTGGRALADPTQAANYDDASNTNAVMGRYAYAVYDTGGLLDVNVAGYLPTEIAGTSGKGYAAYADLTKIPGLDATTLKSLVAWRNRGGISLLGSYTNAVGIYATNGFRTMQAGDNPLFGRRDLLAYFDQNGLNKQALTYFSTFSRSLNAPNWKPLMNGATGFKYSDSCEQGTSINRDLANIRTTSGAPYLTQRFALSRIALLNTTPPSPANVSKISQYFGLTWDTTNKRWTYNHGTAGYIRRLDEAAAAGRDPDFFELLKAAILSGSIGQNPGQIATRANPTANQGATGHNFDLRYGMVGGLSDSHIIQIGVNIIDQYRSDNYPTAIYFHSVTAPLAFEDDLFNTFFGVKDLPYLTQVDAVIWQDTPDRVYGWLQPELWNPHAQLAGTPVIGPKNFRVRPYGDSYVDVDIWYTASGGAASAARPSKQSPVVSYPGDGTGSLYFTAEAPDFRDHPQAIPFAQLDTSLTSASDYMTASTTWAGQTVRAVGIFGGSLPLALFPMANLSPNTTFSIWTMLDPNTTPITLTLDYQAADGSWKPYGYLSRLELEGYSNRRFNYLAGGSLSGSTAYKATAGGTFVFPPQSVGSPLGDVSLARTDPRTDRFSLSLGLIAWPGTASAFLLSSTLQPSAASVNPIYSYWPGRSFSSGVTSVPFSFGDTTKPAGFAQNLPTSTARYTDVDGVLRPGDASTEDTVSGAGAVLFHGGTTAPRRPVVLNRPFTSIAEMGYAFRDLPFRSIDFSSILSADGGLLDVFCLQEESKVVVGQVNPNTASVPVLQAILSGGQQSQVDGSVLSAADVATLAGALAANLNPATPSNSTGPTQSRAELALRLATVLDASSLSTPNKANKAYREAAIRALSSSNTRTWNLLIDVIAQSGKMKPAASSMADFIVQGEKRYWLHIAIDRYTGQVIDRFLEPVYE